jgi:hypothetical protein
VWLLGYEGPVQINRSAACNNFQGVAKSSRHRTVAHEKKVFWGPPVGLWWCRPLCLHKNLVKNIKRKLLSLSVSDSGA